LAGASVSAISGSGVSESYGVYGLNVTGLSLADTFAGPVTAGAPSLEVRQRQLSDATPVPPFLDDRRAVIPLVNGGVLEVTRDPGVATYWMDRSVPDLEMLHPWLVPAVAVMSSWHQRFAFHGGLISARGKALGMMAEREGGKSTLLAWIALQTPMTVMADDLIVAQGNEVHAGPRCIDLRPASLEILPSTATGTVVRDEDRLRLAVPPGPAVAELVGFVVLEWGGTTALERVTPSDRLPALLPHTSIAGVSSRPDGVLALTHYPTWRLTRPRSPDSLSDCADMVRDLLDT
jgi:hypothetical protein